MRLKLPIVDVQLQDNETSLQLAIVVVFSDIVSFYDDHLGQIMPCNSCNCLFKN